MSTHHCCEPGHRDWDQKMRRLRERLHEAESRARFAETTEAVLADRLDEAHERVRDLEAAVRRLEAEASAR